MGRVFLAPRRRSSPRPNCVPSSPRFPHAAACLLAPVARTPDRRRLGVPSRLYRQQGQLLLRRRREQPRDQSGDLRAGRLDRGKHAGQAAYKDFSRIGLYESTNTTKYNSLQLNAEKRFGKGLSVLASYTYSKKQDDYGWTTPDDRRFDDGVSREDVPHNLKFSNVWQIPQISTSRALSKFVNGWMLNSMVTWQSGFPFTISSGRDNSFTGINRDRADFLGGNADLGSDRPHGDMVARYFDTSLFTTNAVGTFGNSGKNMIRGPRYFNTDLALLKVTNVTARVGLQFRAEFFNIFNNVNFNAPNSNVSSAQFGRITSALDPRIVQFGLKMLF